MGDGAISGWTRRRFGTGFGALAAGVLGARAGGGTAARKKKKKRCPKPPRCPRGCTLVFYAPGGGQYCGTGVSLQRDGQNRCVPCSNDGECTSSGFPQCLNASENLATGALSVFPVACGVPATGVCSVAHACPR